MNSTNEARKLSLVLGYDGGDNGPLDPLEAEVAEGIRRVKEFFKRKGGEE